MPSFAFCLITISHLLIYFQQSNATIIDTTTSKQYQFQNITCNDGEACIIICDEHSACRQSAIYCPIDSNCSITCSAEYSCQLSSIYCPINNTCDITCVGDSCYKMQVEWPIIEGYGNIICEGFSTCFGINFPIPDPNKPYILECDHEYECAMADIKCPTNALCDIICSGKWSCWESTINCPTNGNCNISCLAEEACLNATILWSNISTNSGTLICDPNAMDPCLYAVEPPIANINPTTHPITISTITPSIMPSLSSTDPTTTNIPSIAPTIDPIYNVVDYMVMYGVYIEIRFEYAISNTSRSTVMVQSQLETITNNIINKELGSISATMDCLDFEFDNNITVRIQNNINETSAASITTTIFVCDKPSQTMLTVKVKSIELQTNFVNKVEEETGLVINTNSVIFEVDEIVKNEIINNIGNIKTSSFHTSLIIIVNDNDDETAFNANTWLIIAISFVGFLIFILCIIRMIYRQKKLKEITKTDQVMVEMNVNEQQQGINDDIDFEPGSIEYDPKTEDKNNDIGIYQTNNIKKETDGLYIDSVHKPDLEETIMVKLWLQQKVKLPQYYDNFIQNGYESMGIMKEIKRISELKDIGIDDKLHQNQILQAIKQLLDVEGKRMDINENAEKGNDEFENREENDCERNERNGNILQDDEFEVTETPQFATS